MKEIAGSVCPVTFIEKISAFCRKVSFDVTCFYPNDQFADVPDKEKMVPLSSANDHFKTKTHVTYLL